MAQFNMRLRQLRSQNEMSQQELADKIGVTKQTISQYERGVRAPDFENFFALCDIFNVSADYLLGRVDVTVRFLNSDDLEKLSSHPLSPDESSFLANYRALNDTGKQCARERVFELTEIPRYTDKDQESSLSDAG